MMNLKPFAHALPIVITVVLASVAIQGVAPAQIDATIPLRGVPPQFDDPTNAAIRAQEVRRLRLENQKLEQEIQARRAAAQTSPPPVAESARAEWHTQGLMNGRFWKASSSIARATYLMGFCDALEFEASASYRYYATGKNTYGELSDLVDQFYVDPANTLIPVARALALVNLKVIGVEQERVDKLVVEARGAALAK
jgi:hypothetical protein